MKKKITPNLLIMAAFIIAAAAARFFPHPPNFTPVAAMAIFAGAYFTKKYFAVLFPIVAMLVTDSFLGFYPEMWGVYAALILSVVIGFTLRKKVTVMGMIGVSLISSVIFFAVSNFAVWAGSLCGYPHTIGGLTECYIMAIPFFHNEVLGTLVYSGLLFGIYETVARFMPAVR